MSNALAEEPLLSEEFLVPLPAATREGIPSEVAKHVAKGVSVLSAAVFIERGATFLANVLAVRLAGPATFGAYSVGITTANNISVYAAGGIGTTATRFSGKYPYDGGSYRVFAQVMATISLCSAALAALALTLGASPIAALLHRADLAGLLRIAGITAAGMVLLECARGFFVGQQRLVALAALSLLVGLGMLALIPAMAMTGNAKSMVASHGAVTIGAVLLCCVMAARLHLQPPIGRDSGIAFFPLMREVWSYGLVQLSGLVSANVAGWWVTALVARGDSTLAQISFFSIASQLRNLIGLIPSLLTEGSFSAMATPGEGTGTAQRVMMLCTFASTAVSFVVAAITMVGAPLLLRLIYGQVYANAALAVCIAVGVAVIQMGNAPPSARLSVVSIRLTAVINTAWAVTTALLGTALMLHGGNAAQAMAVFLAAHILIALLVLIGLQRRDRLPSGMVSLFIISTSGIVSLALLSAVRVTHPADSGLLSLLMLCVVTLCTMLLYRLGKKQSCLPSQAMLLSLRHRILSSLRRLPSFTAGGKQ
ncbi:lipopolysaccharide biosynthesis protein [Terriglobus roseus]|uniref:Membrane protein involved in the export of O-antigen and teichoic acid n=1 Tax=Terriglobus roseus TaxID=392734 RepID=A0A1G7JBT0_9BACT|nr:oligosaccharide flippase family protein [Terriglobus roseus]SDF22381.1 Membrane protein involved in the export of O-antigen and teichoic acid [Terriglobus roseus]